MMAIAVLDGVGVIGVVVCCLLFIDWLFPHGG
jgi:hypothetical protein